MLNGYDHGVLLLKTEFQSVSAIAAVDLANELMDRDLLGAAELSALSSGLGCCYERVMTGEDVTEERLPETDLVTLWALADQRKHKSSLGFEIGAKVNNQARGLLAHWIACCDNLGEIFSVFTKNVGLLNSAEHWTSRIEDDHCVLDFSHVSALHYPQIAVERSMVAFLAWGEYFCGQPLALEAAYFTFERPEHSSMYTSVFGDNVHFSATRNRLYLAREILDRPVQSANPYIRKLLAKRSSGVFISARDTLSSTAQVQALLLQDLSKFSRLENILDRLNMSRAKLYRKLKAEGSQYSVLLQVARLTQLKGFEKAGLSSEDRAQLMGFSDVSSYYRFLKRFVTVDDRDH